jgi:hypothetical protein
MKSPILKKLIVESFKALECSCFFYSFGKVQKMSTEVSSVSESLSKEANYSTFETLKFDNLVLRTLPIDSISENYVREVKNACFSRVRSIGFILRSIF